MIPLQRVKNLLHYGWLHSNQIAKEEEKGQSYRLRIFFDMMNCYRKYRLFTNQYLAYAFYKISKEERARIGLERYSQYRKRTDFWINYDEEQKFHAKWGSKKYNTIRKNIKRNKAYAKRYNTGEGLWVQNDVIIKREHELDGTIKIGKSVLLAQGCSIDYSGDVTLHDHVGLSAHAIILSHEHRYKDIRDYITEDGHSEAYKCTVELEDHCWLGEGAKVLASCRKIGRGAVVGAGAVCRTSIPPYAIAVGNPAKVVGFRFTLEQILDIEREKYPVDKRIPEKTLRRNFEKYYESRSTESARFIDARLSNNKSL